MRCLIVCFALTTTACIATAQEPAPPAPASAQRVASTTPVYNVNVRVIELPVGTLDKRKAIGWDQWLLLSGAKVLTSPTLRVPEKVRGSVHIGASEKLTYLHRTEDGKLKPREMDAGEIGLSIWVEANDDVAKVSFESVSVSGGVDGEIDVLGIAVPIGMPKLERDQKQIAFTIKSDQVGSTLIKGDVERETHLVVQVLPQTK